MRCQSLAFTLVELLVVMAIIAALAGLLIPTLSALRFRAKATDTTHRMEAVLQGLSVADEEGRGPAYALHKRIIYPQLGDGIVAFHVTSGGVAVSSERVPRTGTWIDTANSHCFPFPWGVASWDDAGEPAPPIAKDLSALTPVLTTALLHEAGVLPTVTDWNAVRAPRAPHNDAWGHPLVVACALFQPKRNTTITSRVRRLNNWPSTTPVPDLHLRLAEVEYQYTRAVYLSVAAAGPRLRAPLTGVAVDDAVAIWAQVLDACDGERWDQTAMATPPWSGVTISRTSTAAGTERCFLAAPIDLR